MEENIKKVVWIVCMPVEVGYKPSLVSWKEQCDRCGAKVWRADIDPKDAKVACIYCAADMAKNEEVDVEVMDVTQKQIKAIINNLTRVKN